MVAIRQGRRNLENLILSLTLAAPLFSKGLSRWTDFLIARGIALLTVKMTLANWQGRNSLLARALNGRAFQITSPQGD